MQPHLSLAYSSQAPIYGGVAAGWSLSIPSITLDTSDGRLEQQQAGAPKQYVSSMAGGRYLVPVVEDHASDVVQTYRAQNDASFTRYEQLAAQYSTAPWRARTTDGLIYTFGNYENMNGSLTGTPACTVGSVDYAPLTRMIDPFGNEVNYYWGAGVDAECRIVEIRWGLNRGTAQLQDFARVVFNYSLTTGVNCPTGTLVGAQTSYRSGIKIVTGASQLDSLTITAHAPGAPQTPEHTRVITLGYTPPAGVDQTTTCTWKHAAYRTLFSIQESAWIGGATPINRVDLPAIKLGYGNAQLGTGNLAWQTSTAPSPWAQAPLGKIKNLGWGYRFNNYTTPDSKRLPTVEAMMVDIDGDGRVDRLSSAPIDDTSGKRHCSAVWERNNGTLTFEPPRRIAMPTLKWASAVGTQPPNCGDSAMYAGSLQPNTQSDGTSDPQLEGCSLNYQRTRYQNTLPYTGICADGSACNGHCANGADCQPARQSTPTYLSFRWIDIDGDGLTDLVASPNDNSLYELQAGFGVCSGAPVPPPEPPLFGHFPACPSVAYAAPIDGPSQKHYTMCNGMYPWLIYKNHGNGVFGATGPDAYSPLPDSIIYQPIPLESEAADASLTSTPVGQRRGPIDMDGDSRLDGTFVNLSPGQWGLFRNNATGVFKPRTSTSAFTFGVPFATTLISKIQYTAPNAQGFIEPTTVQGMFDLEGDGLADHWETVDGINASFLSNDGTGLLNSAYSNIVPVPSMNAKMSCPSWGCPQTNLTCGLPKPNCGLDETPADKLDCGPPGNCFTHNASRLDASRVLDVDLDGRTDIVQISPTGAHGVCYLNHGGTFGAQAPGTVLPVAGLDHTILVSNLVELGKYTWEIRSNILDLDGDGIPESVNFGDAVNPTSMQLQRVPTPTQPPRLLVSIDNQRGATTSIAYAPISDGNVVTRDAGRVMPHTQWVVQSITGTDNLPTPSSTVSTTTYRYKNPVYNEEHDLAPGIIGRHSFRGFEEVTATSPSGSKTVQRYSYDVDWSGRLTTTLVVPAEEPTAVRSISETTWESRALIMAFPSTITTYHSVREDHWTCKNGQTEADCRANTDTFTRTVNTLGALPTVSPRLWTTVYSRLQTSATPVDGDRIVDSKFTLVCDPTHYRLLPDITTKLEVIQGVPTIYGMSKTVYDTSFFVPIKDEQWFDTIDANRAITEREYDLTTGNVTRRWKPTQQAGNRQFTSYQYDSRKLFVATETQESAGNPAQNMVLDYLWEYGTGTKLETRGPNIPACAETVPDTCPPNTPLKETHRTVVDGLGRTLEIWGAWGTSSTSYTQYKLEKFAYVDSALPTSVTHDQGLEGNATATISWASDTTELDGHGRPIKKIVYVQGSAPNNQITTFKYRNDGTLETVKVPDPTANDTSTVTYSYSFDSLGRPTSIRRPDSAIDASGVDMSYDGLTTTSAEHVGASGGIAGSTVTLKDAFGRLREVREQRTVPIPGSHQGAAFAITTYDYDAADNVIRVVDPEGVTTEMKHDFAGRRIEICRAGTLAEAQSICPSIAQPTGVVRKWKYGYDKNGNMISEIVPGYAADQHDILEFTTTTAYDNLDRPISKLLGHRKLSASDLALFGADHEVFTWDYLRNRKGHLYGWWSYGPGASGSNYAVLHYLDWDAAGAPYNTNQNFNAAGYTNLARAFNVDHYMNGLPRLARYGDHPTAPTFATLTLDGRGLPKWVRVTASGGLDQTVAQATRNVAGLVTKSRTNVTGGPMTFVESNWTYDKLGRVTSQVVQKGPGPVQVARQDLAYNGNDDPKSMDHYLGTDLKHFDYTFDPRHQLTSAIETTTLGSYFTASYQYGNAGRFAHATESSSLPPGSDVKPRDVSYQYVDTLPSNHPYGDLSQHPLDREAPLALTDSNGNYASYDYDAAGNQTLRCLGSITSVATQTCTGESWRFVYDGSDQLRRASRFNASGALVGSEEYWYDVDGKRVTTVKRDAGGNKTELIWWIGEAEAHYDATGVLQFVYAYITMGMPVARLERATSKFEVLFHGLGNSTLAAVERLTGTVNTSLRYAPFGEVIEATDAGASSGTGLTTHRRRMNDKFLDEVSELTYYGARFYDRMSMTWTQGDPVGRWAPERGFIFPRHSQLYTNDLNNPLRYLDPDGNEPVMDRAAAMLQVEKAKADIATITQMATDAMYDADHPGQATIAQIREINSIAVDNSFDTTTFFQYQNIAVGFGILAEIGEIGMATSSMSTETRVGATEAEALSAETIATNEAMNAHATFRPGPYAGGSIPARSAARDFTLEERSAINAIGRETGCHTCGNPNPGTKSGNHIPDHQPVSGLNFDKREQSLFPHCKTCSKDQWRAAGKFLQQRAKAAKLAKNMAEDVPIESRRSF